MMLVISVHGVFGSVWHHRALIDAVNRIDDCRGLLFGWSWTITLDAVVNALDAFIEANVRADERVVLVGHSAGGCVVARCRRNRRVVGVIAVASPLNGSALARWVDVLTLHAIPSLRLIGEAVPLLPEATADGRFAVITSNCWPFQSFDGRVFVSEMVHRDARIIGHVERWHSGRQFSDERCTQLLLDWIASLSPDKR
jgi:pimeloyl-ACP methyl ester carboxylesterase